MIVYCATCGTHYNDEKFGRQCPHVNLAGTTGQSIYGIKRTPPELTLPKLDFAEIERKMKGLIDDGTWIEKPYDMGYSPRIAGGYGFKNSTPPPLPPAKRWSSCHSCKGVGWQQGMGESRVPCEACGGLGRMIVRNPTSRCGHMSFYTTCPACLRALCLQCYQDHDCGAGRHHNELQPGNRKERKKRMLDELKTFKLEALDMEELLSFSVFAGGLVGGYNANNLPVPEWLKEKDEILKQRIKSLRRDTLAKELKNAEAQAETLKSAEERRTANKARIDELRAALEGAK